MTVRDFSEDHDDFAVTCMSLEPGAVSTLLGNDNKPVLAAPGEESCIASPQSFDEWFRDVPAVNRTTTHTLLLWEDGSRGFVNRYGAEGERWVALEDETFAAYSADECDVSPCVPCSFSDTTYCTGEWTEYDGTPVFFPADAIDDALDPAYYPAVIPAQYGYLTWPEESAVVDNATLHNFYFTTELRFESTYDPNEASELIIAGDDDIWVFVNGVLALDLGGIHEPTEDSFALSPATAADFGIEAGDTFAVHIFHAKRKREASTYRLRLRGFGLEPAGC